MAKRDQEPTHRIRFTCEDGTTGNLIIMSVIKNATIVVIEIETFALITRENYAHSIRGGVALCHPADKFDLKIGALTAARQAIGIPLDCWMPQEEKAWRRMIYRAIRLAVQELTPADLITMDAQITHLKAEIALGE